MSPASISPSGDALAGFQTDLDTVSQSEPLLPPRLWENPLLPDTDITTSEPLPPLRLLPPPPRLLTPGTPPDPAPPLVPAPALSTAEPIPRRSAENCIRRDSSGRFLGWMDRQQCVFSGRTIAAARWVDDLFGDWDDEEASMQLRAISELTTVEGAGSSFRFRVRASANLPKAKRRLRLIISSDDDRDERVAGQDALSQLRQTSNDMSAALRWMSSDKLPFKTDFDVGIRGIGPPDVFARLRGREDWSLAQDTLFRFSQTFRYGTESQGRSISDFALEHVLGESTVARLSSAYEYDQQNNLNGMVWAQGLSLSHVMGDTKTLSYGVTVNGHLKPDWRSDNKGPWLVWRSGFLRDWLFYEVEPRLTWYNTESRWEAVWSLTLRLEVQFGRK